MVDPTISIHSAHFKIGLLLHLLIVRESFFDGTDAVQSILHTADQMVLLLILFLRVFQWLLNSLETNPHISLNFSPLIFSWRKSSSKL
jgi:hypothetical protein